jgi:3-phenylpropionate/cinnamic acid dioxygenase small subunit
MRISRAMLTGLLAVSMLQAATAAEERSAADQARDRAVIEALMWRYIRALDTADADAYAAAFTADGTFTAGQNTERGAAELKKMINDFKARRAEQQTKGAAPTPALYHVVANHTITFVDRDHARYDAYWMTMAASAGPETPARVAGVGRSVDMLVRQHGQWLIQSRDVAPK